MTIFLIILLVIAVGVIIQQYRYRRRITKHSTWLESEYMTIQEKLGDAYSAYAALETGQQEIIDNYENDFLSMGEQVEAAKNAAKYDREKREEVEGLLALKDKIIEKHAGTCDSILAEVVNEMVAELRPSDE
jgi:K+-sensing histidine kinase KdpD